jgi:hypothetical protein
VVNFETPENKFVEMLESWFIQRFLKKKKKKHCSDIKKSEKFTNMKDFQDQQKYCSAD